MSRRSLLAVFAHPDDEAYSIGGSLSRYAAEGCDVHLVTATQFNAGAVSDEQREMLAGQLFREELFILARSTAARPPGLETDLFAGIGAPPGPAGD